MKSGKRKVILVFVIILLLIGIISFCYYRLMVHDKLVRAKAVTATAFPSEAPLTLQVKAKFLNQPENYNYGTNFRSNSSFQEMLTDINKNEDLSVTIYKVANRNIAFISRVGENPDFYYLADEAETKETWEDYYQFYGCKAEITYDDGKSKIEVLAPCYLFDTPTHDFIDSKQYTCSSIYLDDKEQDVQELFKLFYQSSGLYDVVEKGDMLILSEKSATSSSWLWLTFHKSLEETLISVDVIQ